MNRRSLFKAFGAVAAGLFMPPVRAVGARVRRLVNPVWRVGTPLWEHLAIPEPVSASGLSPEYAVAHRVCRVLNPAKAPRSPVRDVLPSYSVHEENDLDDFELT